MGRDKAELSFGGETFLQRAVRVAGTLGGEVIVVARADQALNRENLPAVPVRIVHDAVEDQGPLAGLAAGLSASATGINVVMACDMPLIRTAVLQRLIDRLGDADACVAVVDGRPNPLCAVFRSTVASVATALLAAGERRVTALLDRVPTNRVDAAELRDIDPDLDSFVSCNTPEAYLQVRLKADTTLP